MLDAVEAAGAEELWCLGDLVGYGAEPDACVELARRHVAVCLAGNHDLAVCGELPLDQFARGAELSIALDAARSIAPASTSPSSRRSSRRSSTRRVGLYHASPRDPVWEYVLSPLQAELCLDAARAPRRLHRPLARRARRSRARDGRDRDRRDAAAAGPSSTSPTGTWLLNPGSVGQPRDGDPRAAWLLLDTTAWTAAFHRTEYDVAGAAAAIRAARLPDSLAERLAHGQ